MSEKKRLDIVVFERGLAPSRELAQRYIMAGEVSVNGQIQTKVGVKVPDDADIVVKQAAPFVGRGGFKLQTALHTFPISVEGKICADVGASTGGFTDCLLQHGATKVYAIDVCYGQLALKLRNDPRIVNMERTNARYLENLPEHIHLAVMDVSFISIQLLLPVIKNWLLPIGDVISLIKPQFEAGREDVGKGGIVKDHDVHRRVLIEVLTASQHMGYTVRGLVQSEITGTKGNIEFLVWLSIGQETEVGTIETLIDALFKGIE
jgi:23S rRNA (cytidine1920-2'-O)/16S rRNA (cytidine1409-2'-O)-methyltransferase